MAKASRWVVTSSGDRSLAEIRKDLVDAGFTIDQAMDDIGVITGTSDEAVAKKLRDLKGIADVSPDREIDIGPPGSDKTW